MFGTSTTHIEAGGGWRASRGSRMLATGVGALSLVVTACGAESVNDIASAGDGRDATRIVNSRAASTGRCGEGGRPTLDSLRRASSVVLESQFVDSINAVELGALADAERRGGTTRLGVVSEVSVVDEAPYDFVPATESGSPTNAAAGNSVHWSGVEVVVSDESGAVTVQLPLAVGGTDVVAALRDPEASSWLTALRGACALVVTGEDGVPAALGGARLVAVSTDPEETPVPFDPQFRTVVDRSPTMAALIGSG